MRRYRRRVSGDAAAADAAPPAPKKASRRSQVISALVMVVTLVVVFFFLAEKFGGYADAISAIKAMPAWSLALLGVAVVLNIVVYVWPFLVALPGLRFGPGFVVRQTSFLISNTVPAGGAFGLAVQYGMLGSYGIGAGATTSAIAINSVWNVLATIAMPAIGAIALLISGDLTTKDVVIGGVSLLVVVVAAVVLRLILSSEQGARRVGTLAENVVEWLLRVVRRPRHVDVTTATLNLRSNMAGTVDKAWIRLSLSNLAMQLTAWFVLFVALRGVQAESGPPYVTWSQSLAAFALARLATFIPITPGGLGTVDAALTTLLVDFGASNSEALAATLVWRAGTFVPQALLGVVTLVWWRATKRRREARLASGTS